MVDIRCFFSLIYFLKRKYYPVRNSELFSVSLIFSSASLPVNTASYDVIMNNSRRVEL